MIALEGAHWRDATPRADAPRCAIPGHEHELAHNCRSCAGDRMAALAPDLADDLTISAAQAEVNKRGAAKVLAALHLAKEGADRG